MGTMAEREIWEEHGMIRPFNEGKMFIMLVGVVAAVSLLLLVPSACADTPEWDYSKWENPNVTTQDVTGLNESQVILNGMINESVTGKWFIIGSQPGKYPWRTKNITEGTTPGIYNTTIKGMPIMQNRTYYYRAASSIGYGEEKSFFQTAMTPRPTTTYGQYSEDFLAQEGNYTAWVPIIWKPYTDHWGEYIFYSIVIGIIFIVLAMRTGNVMIPTILFYLIGVPLLTLMNTEFIAMAQTFMIIATAGLVYWFFQKSNG
jgi:hypothetical protein